MADIGHALRIKYGLSENPPDYLIAEWEKLARQNIERGFGLEAAGQAAAKVVFPDYQSHFFRTEADTIEMLLERIRDRR